jgi:CRISPR/Cas system CMR subunit Cmr6 (Cas7 group RAMP superfamily)
MKIIFFLSAFFFKLINLDFSAFAETLDQMDEHFKNLLENKSRNDSNIREEITKDVNKYLNEEYRKRYPREEDKFTKFFKSTENILNKKIYFDNLTVGSVLKMVSFMILVDKVFFFTVDTIY